MAIVWFDSKVRPFIPNKLLLDLVDNNQLNVKITKKFTKLEKEGRCTSIHGQWQQVWKVGV